MRVLSHHIPAKFTGTQSNVSVSHTTSTPVLSANPARQYLLFQNNDAANKIYLSLDGTAATATDFVLAAGGGSLELAVGVPTTAVTALAATGTTALVVLEG